MGNIFDIDDGMLMEYFGDGGELVIPEGVRDIFFEVFEHNAQITRVIIPGSITDLTLSAFSGCTALKEAILSEGVEIIGSWAFQNCTALSCVTLPASLKEIQKNAFAGCTALREICYGGTEEQWKKVTRSEGWNKDTVGYTVIFNSRI